MLIEVLPRVGQPLDDAAGRDGRQWQASPQARFERLLRESGVPTGLLCNGTELRLVYAPRGENSGHVTFPVPAMTEVAGRVIFAALHLLLSAERLFGVAPKQRLTAILEASRRYQNTVSTQLAEQVLAALYELLRGFQAADDLARGELLGGVLQSNPDHVYRGLLTVLMRLVFLLYAEDRGLMSSDPIYVNHYSVGGLYERLRDDASRHHDTMDQRYGAWAQLVTLFRMVHDGAGHGGLRLPARHGYLFDPNRYPFLESRPGEHPFEPGQRIRPPLVSDGCVYRVLHNLLVVDGERLSYRALDVEHVGSVYEAIMGFHLGVARGRSIAVKSGKARGAPVTINLDELLAEKPERRAKWLKDRTDQSLTGKALNDLKAAATAEAVVAALDRKVAREATPNVVPPGAMVLQPSDERRRSGTHYTPRGLTEPIVRKTLEPVLKGLGSGESGRGGRHDRVVSRSQGVATGDVPGQGVLPADTRVSQGRAVRDDQSDSPGLGAEHRGRGAGPCRGVRRATGRALRDPGRAAPAAPTHLGRAMRGTRPRRWMTGSFPCEKQGRSPRHESVEPVARRRHEPSQCRRSEVRSARQQNGRRAMSHQTFCEYTLQIVNIMLFQSPQDCVLALGSRIQNVHLKEFDRTGTDHSLACFRTPLDGSTDWPAVLEAFARIGDKGYLTFEYFHPFPHYPEALIWQTSDALDRILGKKR